MIAVLVSWVDGVVPCDTVDDGVVEEVLFVTVVVVTGLVVLLTPALGDVFVVLVELVTGGVVVLVGEILEGKQTVALLVFVIGVRVG